MSNLCNVYSSPEFAFRSARDLADIKTYCQFTQSRMTGPMGNAPHIPSQVCSAPYGYRTLGMAYQLSSGPHLMSLGMANKPY